MRHAAAIACMPTKLDSGEGQDYICRQPQGTLHVAQPGYREPYGQQQEPAGLAHPAGNGGGGKTNDFFAFRSFIAPIVTQVAFWVSVFLCLMSGIYIMAADFVGHSHEGSAAWQIIAGLIIIILGPIMARVCCELLILAFRIHDELKRVNQSASYISHGILRLIERAEAGDRASSPEPSE